MIVHTDKLRDLTEEYTSMKRSQLIITSGEHGIGKSETISCFLQSCPNHMTVPCIHVSSFLLEPIVYALQTFASSNGEDSQAVIDKNDLNYSEKVMDQLYRICRAHEKMVLFFEKINGHKAHDLLLFIGKVIQVVVNQNPILQTLIILEIDSDDEQYGGILKIFNALTPSTSFVNFKKVKDGVLRSYFYDSFSNNISIASDYVNYIIESSFGNPAYLNIIMNYLKQEEYIVRLNGSWTCLKPEKGIFSHVLKEHIIGRYEKLDDQLKTVLKQSSIVGFEINSNLLMNPFRIIHADDYLKKIESISSLLKETGSGEFVFENDAVHLSINNLVPANEKMEWNNLLAKYFEQKYERETLWPPNKSLTKMISLLYRIVLHYEEAHGFIKALSYTLKLFPLYSAIMDYSSLLKVINKAQAFNEVTLNDDEMKSMLLIWKADCYRYIGRYDEAVMHYEQYLNDFKSILDQNAEYELRYHLTFCHYNNGNSSEALNMLLKLKDEMKKDHSNPQVFYRVLSLISSVYDLQENTRKASRYFNWSLNQCYKLGLEDEYHVQLRKSNMIIDGQLALNKIKTAIEYFENKRNMREAAKAMHNYGNELLYHLQYEPSEEYLSRSTEIFRSYYSNDIKYPLNSLAISLFLNKGDYSSSLNILEGIFNKNDEVFSRITLLINTASCYRKLLNETKCLRILEECKYIMDNNTHEKIPILEVYLTTNFGLYYKEMQKYELALEWFERAINIESIPNIYLKVVAKNICDLLSCLNRAIPKQILECKNITAPAISDAFYLNDVVLADFMFWE